MYYQLFSADFIFYGNRKKYVLVKMLVENNKKHSRKFATFYVIWYTIHFYNLFFVTVIHEMCHLLACLFCNLVVLEFSVKSRCHVKRKTKNDIVYDMFGGTVRHYTVPFDREVSTINFCLSNIFVSFIPSLVWLLMFSYSLYGAFTIDAQLHSLEFLLNYGLFMYLILNLNNFNSASDIIVAQLYIKKLQDYLVELFYKIDSRLIYATSISLLYCYVFL